MCRKKRRAVKVQHIPLFCWVKETNIKWEHVTKVNCSWVNGIKNCTLRWFDFRSIHSGRKKPLTFLCLGSTSAWWTVWSCSAASSLTPRRNSVTGSCPHTSRKLKRRAKTVRAAQVMLRQSGPVWTDSEKMCLNMWSMLVWSTCSTYVTSGVRHANEQLKSFVSFLLTGTRDWNICSSISDKMGIKTTVHEIVATRYNMYLPDPVTHADFLKCKCVYVFFLFSRHTWAEASNHSSTFCKCWSCSDTRGCSLHCTTGLDGSVTIGARGPISHSKAALDIVPGLFSKALLPRRWIVPHSTLSLVTQPNPYQLPSFFTSVFGLHQLLMRISAV